jgi:hypothetical protein
MHIFGHLWESPAVDPDTGLLRLRYSQFAPGFIICGALGMLICLNFIVAGQPLQDAGDLIFIAACYAIVAVIAIAFLWECVGYKVVVGPDGLDCHSAWRGSRFITWQAVEQLSYDPGDQSFTLNVQEGRPFRLPAAIVGVRDFLAACQQYLPKEKLAPAENGYRKFGYAGIASKSEA